MPAWVALFFRGDKAQAGSSTGNQPENEHYCKRNTEQYQTTSVQFTEVLC